MNELASSQVGLVGFLLIHSFCLSLAKEMDLFYGKRHEGSSSSTSIRVYRLVNELI